MVPQLPPDIRTPAYVIDVAQLQRNLRAAERIRKEAGCGVLLATKAFAMAAAFPFMRDSLDGTTASGLYEALYGQSRFGKEVHVYSPAYTREEFDALAGVAGHMYFNSRLQLDRYSGEARARGQAVGLRINPGFSRASIGGALYDPCAPNSRFGETPDVLSAVDWSAVDILHAHALCEADHDGSIGLIDRLAASFPGPLERVRAVNLGGGHFLNRAGYDVDALIRALRAFRARFNVRVYLEPGGGLVVNAGYLVATVVDLHRNGKDIAILDASASCHMPDVLEAPYRPEIIGSGAPGELAHSYILAGKTCMTGDIIGEYSFARPLAAGDRLVFTDMAQYSFVKNTTFNGTPLPDLALLHEDGRYEVVRRFGYDDFAGRLG
jgi:carboxynorspermidine decarboxylase